MWLKIELYSLSGQPKVRLIFILSKHNDFQLEALPKMTPLSPSVEKFSLDIRKKVSSKQAKAYLFKNNKNTLKNTGFKGNFKYN